MTDKMTCKIKPLPIEDEITLEAWLEKHAQPDDILLAHALDGVIWGKIDNGKLTLQPIATLNPDTLQELRLFNHEREIHVWRTGDTWHARQIVDKTDISEDEYIEESHILWGTKKNEKEENGIFTTVEDGAQGLSHAVPIKNAHVTDKNRLTLRVRHYFGEDDNGVNYIAYSRLVNLDVKEFKNEQ
ncbi:MAG: TIGR03984 family CRISPR-associated protein [Anaerolineae bacterium]|nr:TIGR03984 family CRISPR-associated protein [Anaerolineae bacterium]